MPNYDVFVYRDLSDYTDAPAAVGMAWPDPGNGDGMHIVAMGRPIHEGKDATIVLAVGARPLEDVQRLLDSL